MRLSLFSDVIAMLFGQRSESRHCVECASDFLHFAFSNEQYSQSSLSKIARLQSSTLAVECLECLSMFCVSFSLSICCRFTHGLNLLSLLVSFLLVVFVACLISDQRNMFSSSLCLLSLSPHRNS